MLGLNSSSERRKAGTEKIWGRIIQKTIGIKSRVSALTCMALPKVIKHDWGKIMHVH